VLARSMVSSRPFSSSKSGASASATGMIASGEAMSGRRSAVSALGAQHADD
jgi:hypothetical protein